MRPEEINKLNQVIEKINAFITQLSDPEMRQSLDNDTKILSLGFLDSFNILEIITFIEEEFGVKVNGDLITLERFNSINLIASLVKELKEMEIK